jgi:hypothetical protein
MGCLPRLLVTGFGAIFLVVGIWVGVFEARSARADAALAESLAPVSARAIDNREPGQETLVEGALSLRNPARFRDFVAYRREEYRGEEDDGDDIWREDERVTPALLIEAAGVVQLANDDYALDGPLVLVDEDRPLRYAGGQGSKRYYGLPAGRTVIAIGAVEPGPEGNLLRARVVFAGSRAEYIAARSSDAAWLPWFGLIFGAVGLVIIGLAFFLRR